MKIGSTKSRFISRLTLSAGLLFGTLLFAAYAEALPRLAVSSNGHYLMQLDGSPAGLPFFWQADTAWNLASVCEEDRDGDGTGDIEQYIQDRAAKGYNVVQGPIIINTNSFSAPSLTADCYGNLALSNWTPGTVTLNEAYLRHIDYIVNTAREHGLYIALPVIWGAMFDHYFSVNNTGDAYRIGQVLAQRYNQDNVIWIVAGEYQKIAWETVARDRTEPSAQELDLIRQLALGLASVHQGTQLMTVHPDGGQSSSGHFHGEPWLDFNMIQTFAIDESGDAIVFNDWQRVPTKPTVNAEPAYEDRDAQFLNDPVTARKVRYEAYQAVFQGAFGHTYGHWNIWQFSPNWQASLDAEGAVDMKYLRGLVESRPFLVRIPDQGMIVGPAGDYAGLSRVRATRASDGSYAFIYFPGENISQGLDLSRLSGASVRAWWYNPRDGLVYDGSGQPSAAPFGNFSTASTSQVFDPPGFDAAQDWVLVLDDVDRNFPAPGAPAAGITPAAGIPVVQLAVATGPFAINQIIEAEDFDEGGQGVAYYDVTPGNSLGGDYRPGEDVDIESGRGASNGFSVGLVQLGEWLRYTVDIPASGLYDIDIRTSQPLGGGQFHLDFNGDNVTGVIYPLPSGDPQNWDVIKVSGVKLNGGVQQMRIVPDRVPSWTPDIGNLDWFRITPSSAPALIPRPPAPPVFPSTNFNMYRGW
ncbi:MAG: hypothetical protein FD165_648 [Gammaproteobacteria bacterium]|nr:MAG: hypothetical protein FD165_648 [Gammaproteobacteria bacterium]TND02088.1 MAG: hypothetical protein FD120_2252 [Gammaproteobacteria bacterium]